jgi:hypothetical protein
VSISAPGGWPVIAQRAPLVTLVTSGDAVIALWRYPRPQAPPASAAALSAARDSLFAAVRARQGSVRVISSRLTRIDGAPAIEFNALESIAGRRRQVFSTHVFTAGGEVVLEEYAPPRTFLSLRRPLFARVRSSLAVIGVRGGR